jgi:rod shape determining protein RodA
MKREGSVWSNIDWLTFGLYLTLVLFGWLTVYAVQFGPESSALFDFGGIHGRQLTWIIFSILVGLVILLFDSEFFPGFSWVIYGFFMALLLLVTLVGREVNGARAWLDIGPLKLQPGEFAKYATAIALAKYLSLPGVNMGEMQYRLRALAVAGLPMALIVLQKDVGTSLVFFSFLLPMYREGFSMVLAAAGTYLGVLFILSMLIEPVWLLSAAAVLSFLVCLVALQRPWRKQRELTRWILLLLLGGFAALITFSLLVQHALGAAAMALAFLAALYWLSTPLRKERRLVLAAAAAFVMSLFFAYYLVDFVFNDVLQPHQQERILTLVGQSTDRDANYNVDQSKMTIASGGFWGKGYLQGTFTRYGHVPEQQTDFIFCTIGEELGFVGSFLFLMTYLALLLRIIFLAERQRSPFTRVFAYSVAGLFFVQITINIGMTIGLVPVIGIPLPFVSYGGSSVLAFSLLIFTLLRLDADRLMVLR